MDCLGHRDSSLLHAIFSIHPILRMGCADLRAGLVTCRYFTQASLFEARSFRAEPQYDIARTALVQLKLPLSSIKELLAGHLIITKDCISTQLSIVL
jgi:hypothetical protein